MSSQRYLNAQAVNELTGLNAMLGTRVSYTQEVLDAHTRAMDALHRIVTKVRDTGQSEEVIAFWGGIVKDLYDSLNTFERLGDNLVMLSRANDHLVKTKDDLLEQIKHFEELIENMI